MLKFCTAILSLMIAFSPIVLGQIHNNNPYLERTILLNEGRFENLYRFHLQDSLLQFAGKPPHKQIGFDITGGYQNQLPNHYSVYNDEFHFLGSPYFYSYFHQNISFGIRVNIENVKDQITDENKPYWGDDFGGVRGGLEIGYVKFSNRNFEVKFGRDYFMPGYYPGERLLFSKYQYSYDQLKFVYRNRFLEFSSYYFPLIRMAENVNRHLHGHRLSINLFGRGYVALNDVVLYGGEFKQIEAALLNPFIPYYVYSQNTAHFLSNTLLSLEFFYKYKKAYLFGEFLLDDYQIEKKTPADLEPNEFGYNITAGIENLLPGLNWSLNHTKVSNRTYNSPDNDWEKYINKNYPIGHFRGNNFWEISTSMNYYYSRDLAARFSFYYNEAGEEALYGEFNKDFLDYTVEEGYSEPFPFGEVERFSLAEIKFFYNVTPNILVNGSGSYWFKAPFSLKDFGYNIYVSYHF